ncbi:MAG: hypothetical protein HQK51_13770 [Oligoflexia bacterium]|nr:hypothetical protein [Oligoflexia bacterium]
MSNLVKKKISKRSFIKNFDKNDFVRVNNKNLPHLTLIKNDEYIDKNEVMQALHVDLYYEQEIFPLIERDGYYFNMWVFFASSYWYAYKGMWEIWAKWTLPLHAFIALTFTLEIAPVAILVGLPVCYYLASTANTFYYMKYNSYLEKEIIPKTNSIMSGIMGVVGNISIYLIVSWIVSMIKVYLL